MHNVFEEHGGKCPEEAIVGGCLDEGRIVSFLVMQPILHMEPLWIHQDYRGRVSFARLAKLVEDSLDGDAEFYVFAPNSQIERMAEIVGLEKLDWSVWRKKVN